MNQVMLRTQRPRHDEGVAIPVGVRRTFSTLSSIYNSKESRAIENTPGGGRLRFRPTIAKQDARRDLPGSAEEPPKREARPTRGYR